MGCRSLWTSPDNRNSQRSLGLDVSVEKETSRAHFHDHPGAAQGIEALRPRTSVAPTWVVMDRMTFISSLPELLSLQQSSAFVHSPVATRVSCVPTGREGPGQLHMPSPCDTKDAAVKLHFSRWFQHSLMDNNLSGCFGNACLAFDPASLP